MLKYIYIYIDIKCFRVLITWKLILMIDSLMSLTEVGSSISHKYFRSARITTESYGFMRVNSTG